jgi:hypothetical protein
MNKNLHVNPIHLRRTIMRGIWIVLLTAAIGLAPFGPSGVIRAQSGVTVSGTVADQTGAVIPGENFTLLNKTTGETLKTVSDDSGHFNFSSVVPGEYILKGVAEGFQPFERAITVGAKPVTVQVKMEISISEDVTVSAKASEPELPENNADAVNFSNSLLGYLPTQNQDILPVLNNFLSSAAMDSKGPSIVVDGVESSDLNLPTDAIKAVFINKNPYSVEYRRPGLARVEVTTQRGARGYYDGSAALSAQNSKLSARNAFAVQKPDLDMRLFSASLGGPLPFVDRTTFFFSANRLMDDRSAVVNALTLSGPLNENVPTFRRKTNLLARTDVKLNKLNRITLNYNIFDQPERNRGVGGLRLAEQGISADGRGHRFQFTDSTTFSTNFLNTLRFMFERRNQRLGTLADKPAIQVKGAFTGGPSQIARSNQETSVQFQDVAVYSHGNQTLHFGAVAQPKFFQFSDATNFGGTFIFSKLSEFAAGHPIQFQIVQGDPDVSFSQPEAYGFFQDEIKLSQHSNLMLGLRYEWQAKLRDHNNFAPRLAFAFAPGHQKTVFRAGAGIFYDRLPDTAVQRSLLIDGVQTRELKIANPSFPDQFMGGNSRPPLPSVWRIAPDISAPYLCQASGGVERKLGTATQLTLDYQTLHAVHLFRARNINAPLPETKQLPDPNFDNISQVESSASLRSNALVVTLRGEFINHFKGTAQYTLSRTTDDTNGAFELPANNYDRRPERGRSNLDKRQRFNFAGTYSMPWDLKIAGVLSLTTGAPYDITTGSDNNSDSVVNDRPPGVTRNMGQGPGYAQLDLRLSKFFPLPTPFRKETKPGSKFRNLALNADLFNVFNHNNLSNVIGNISSPTLFGKANASLQPRTVQLSFKYSF